MSDVLTLAQAEDLAARTLAAIDDEDVRPDLPTYLSRSYTADRARVASDLAGLREAYDERDGHIYGDGYISLARYCSDGLRRTADLYGVTA